jgi:hypothetical protein
MSSISKRALASRQTALDRPELREPSSPRQAANPGGTMAIKVQRTPEQDAAIKQYLKAKQLAQIGKDFAWEGLELVEEGLEQVGRSIIDQDQAFTAAMQAAGHRMTGPSNTHGTEHPKFVSRTATHTFPKSSD